MDRIIESVKLGFSKERMKPALRLLLSGAVFSFIITWGVFVGKFDAVDVHALRDGMTLYDALIYIAFLDITAGLLGLIIGILNNHQPARLYGGIAMDLGAVGLAVAVLMAGFNIDHGLSLNVWFYAAMTMMLSSFGSNICAIYHMGATAVETLKRKLLIHKSKETERK